MNRFIILETLKEWSETDGFEYVLYNGGKVGRREIGSIDDFKEVRWNYILNRYQEK
jgi:hypothetical protein